MPWCGAPPPSTTPRGACHTASSDGCLDVRTRPFCKGVHASDSSSRLIHVQRGRWLAQVSKATTGKYDFKSQVS